jgi:crossover junction endodeoxyribonuclease RuvC
MTPEKIIGRFLGIDPGLNFTGWGIVDYISADKFTYIASGIIKTVPKMEYSQRLNHIFNQSLKIIENYSPKHAAIEDTYVNVNNKSSIMLAQAKAASIIAISQNNIPLVEYAAKKVKKTISGTGNADKSQIIKMISYWLPNISVKFSDEADALAIALCHASHYKHSEKI